MPEIALSDARQRALTALDEIVELFIAAESPKHKIHTTQKMRDLVKDFQF